MVLVEIIYRLTDALPTKEIYGLQSQMRRAAVSVPSNIAEGAARKSDKELIQFMHIALGSCAELETQLIICQRIYSLKVEEEMNELEKSRKLMIGFIRYIQNKNT